MTSDNAAAAVNSAVNHTIISNAGNSLDDLKNTISSQFVKQGLNNADANRLSDLAGSFVQGEIAGRFQLDSTTSANNLNAQDLTNRLHAQNIQHDTAQSAVNNALNAGNFQTARELRDGISSELVTQGVNQGTALVAATHAVVPAGAPATVPSVSQNELNAQASAQVVSLLGQYPNINSDQAKSVASEVTNTISGIRDSLQTHINTLRSQNNASVDNALDNNLRTFLKPTLSLYNFSQRLLDPARTLINMWGINERTTLPTNFEKNSSTMV